MSKGQITNVNKHDCDAATIEPMLIYPRTSAPWTEIYKVALSVEMHDQKSVFVTSVSVPYLFFFRINNLNFNH